MIERGVPLPGMLGMHPAMLAAYALARKAARAQLPVVIVGETGTGKELVARALHELSAVKSGPFIDVNCAAIHESLAEAELFGWERGAFTGAHARTPGLLEAAHGGTLFLDEAGSLPLAMQARLLRALELGLVRRLGARTSVAATFRLVLATAEPVEALARAGTFRSDFAHRVRGIEIVLPPLRERRSDLPLLAAHFLNAANGHPPRRLDAEALHVLGVHPWPGNVRELKTTMERVVALTEDETVGGIAVASALPGATGAAEGDRIVQAVAQCGGSLTKAARLLGVPRTTLRRRLDALGGKRAAS